MELSFFNKVHLAECAAQRAILHSRENYMVPLNTPQAEAVQRRFSDEYDAARAWCSHRVMFHTTVNGEPLNYRL